MTDALSLLQKFILICQRVADADGAGLETASEIVDELAVTPVQTLDDLLAKAEALLWVFGSKGHLAERLRGAGGAANELIASLLLGLLAFSSIRQPTEG